MRLHLRPLPSTFIARHLHSLLGTHIHRLASTKNLNLHKASSFTRHFMWVFVRRLHSCYSDKSLSSPGAEFFAVMAEERSRSKGPVRHIVLLKVEKKEDVPEVVKTLADMATEIVKGKHVSWINFDINSDLGIGVGNADVGLVVDFPDEESFQTYQKHDLHVAAVTHNRKFVVSRTAIQLPLPNSSL